MDFGSRKCTNEGRGLAVPSIRGRTLSSQVPPPGSGVLQQIWFLQPPNSKLLTLFCFKFAPKFEQITPLKWKTFGERTASNWSYTSVFVWLDLHTELWRLLIIVLWSRSLGFCHNFNDFCRSHIFVAQPFNGPNGQTNVIAPGCNCWRPHPIGMWQ